MKLSFSLTELETIQSRGEICLKSAKDAMERSQLSFDDIERINNHFENHKWGSSVDRTYRKRAIQKAIEEVAKNPTKFI